MENDVKELQAMLIHLTKRIEKLEKKSFRLANASTYLKELKQEAAKILSSWS